MLIFIHTEEDDINQFSVPGQEDMQSTFSIIE